MKQLLLMRHAKSSWNSDVQDDFERPLNDRGMSDAPEMGRRLNRRNFKPEIIITSMALRALTTSKMVANAIEYPHHKIEKDISIYHAGIHELIHVIRSINDNHHSAMLVGHNPTFTSMIGYLSHAPLDHLPTSGMALLEFPIISWQQATEGNAKLIWIDAPKTKTA